MDLQSLIFWRAPAKPKVFAKDFRASRRSALPKKWKTGGLLIVLAVPITYGIIIV